jgi:hypothetical protein
MKSLICRNDLIKFSEHKRKDLVLKNSEIWAGGMAEVVDHLPGK